MQQHDYSELLSTYDLILSRLRDPKSGGGDKRTAFCPAHDDVSRKSFSIDIVDAANGPGRLIVMTCYTGCSNSEICDALGIKESDLFSRPIKQLGTPTIVATYDYCDASGVIAENSDGRPYVREGLKYQSVRLEPGREGRKKDFFQRAPAGNGEWTNNLKGVKGRWPWLLPELLKFVAQKTVPAGIVFIVEGEKDVLTLRRLGYCATTSAGGAGKWPGSHQFNSYFQSCRLVIIADNDNCNRQVGAGSQKRPCGALQGSTELCLGQGGPEHRFAGLDHANDVSRKTRDYASRIQVLTQAELPGLPAGGGDISDWLAASGHTIAELLRICELADDWRDPGKPEKREIKKGDRITQAELRDRWLAGSSPLAYARGEFYEYANGLWAARPDTLLKKQLAKIIQKAETEGVELAAPFANSVYELAKWEVSIEDKMFDSNADYIVCANGALHIPTRTQQPHSPKLYATKGVPYDYDPKANGPWWDKYIEWLTGRLGEETVSFLQEYAGLCATTNTKYEIAVWLYGQRRCGKSTFIEGIMAALGDRWCNFGLRNIERSEFALANVAGKTLAIATELPGDYIRCADLLQAIISGEPLEVRRLYHDFITITPTLHLLWSTDRMPRVAHAGAGLFERVQLVDFGKEIPMAERDPEIKAGIQQEGPYILNWLLDGYDNLNERGRFAIPPRVRASTEGFQAVNDVVAGFAAEWLEFYDDALADWKRGGEKGPAPDVEDYKEPAEGGDDVEGLYKCYSKHCETGGNKRLSRNSVTLEWVRLGLEKRRTTVNGRQGSWWYGARLKMRLS